MRRVILQAIACYLSGSPVNSPVTQEQLIMYLFESIKLRRSISQNHTRFPFGSRVDDLTHRFISIAECAFAVRIVLCPHHPVRANIVEQLETDEIGLEGGIHIILPIMTRLMFWNDIIDCLVCPVSQLGILQCAGNPIYSTFGKDDLQMWMPVQDASENQIAENPPKWRRLDQEECTKASAGTIARNFTNVKIDR